MNRDNGWLFVLLVLLMAIPAVYGQWGSVRQRGSVTNGNIVVWYRNNEVSDSGITPQQLTNIVADIARVLGTNTATTIEFTSRKDQPNGYAGLDANGMIGTNVIANIYVVFDGGPRD